MSFVVADALIIRILALWVRNANCKAKGLCDLLHPPFTPVLLSLAIFCSTILLCILLGEASLIFMYSWYKQKKGL